MLAQGHTLVLDQWGVNQTMVANSTDSKTHPNDLRPTRLEPTGEKLRAFISYSRADTAFADELAVGLEYDGGFDVIIDRHAIQEGEAWKDRLGALILAADTVVFVLSPKSAASPICRWEVEEAQRRSKRILPVLAVPVGDTPVPEPLAALNYVRFDPEADGKPRSDSGHRAPW